MSKSLLVLEILTTFVFYCDIILGKKPIQTSSMKRVHLRHFFADPKIVNLTESILKPKIPRRFSVQTDNHT